MTYQHIGGGWECVDAWPWWVEMIPEGHTSYWQFELDDFNDFACKRMQGYWRQCMHAALAEREDDHA